MRSLETSHAAEPMEYSLLTDTRADGPVIATYMDCPVVEALLDAFGRRYVYAGVAPRRSGWFDIEALRPGEFILQPGLIYRLETKPKPPGKRLFRFPILPGGKV